MALGQTVNDGLMRVSGMSTRRMKHAPHEERDEAAGCVWQESIDLEEQSPTRLSCCITTTVTRSKE